MDKNFLDLRKEGPDDLDTTGLTTDVELPKNFDIKDVEDSSNHEEGNLEKAGSIEIWKRLKFNEKAKARPFITGIVLLVWFTWVIVGLVRLVITGETFLLITSPALLSVPVYRIVKFYFSDG